MKQLLAFIIVGCTFPVLTAIEEKKEPAGEIFTQYQAGIKTLGDLKSDLSQMRKANSSWYAWFMGWLGSSAASDIRSREKQIEQVESSLESMQMRAIDHSYNYNKYLRERVDLLEQQVLSVTGHPIEKVALPKEPELATQDVYALEYDDAEFSPEEAADLAQLAEYEEEKNPVEENNSDSLPAAQEKSEKESNPEIQTTQLDDAAVDEMSAQELDDQLAEELK